MGPVLTCVVASPIGKLTLRLSGHYLPLATIAWGLSLYFLFGTMASSAATPASPASRRSRCSATSCARARRCTTWIWLFVLAGVLTTSNLLDSREGRAIRALKGGMVMAEAMGVDTARARAW